MDKGRFICAAQNINKAARHRRHRVSLKKVDLNQIKLIFDYRQTRISALFGAES